MENTILSGVHQAIGNTPMVHLSRLAGFSSGANVAAALSTDLYE
jgi:cysteine synthase